MRIKPTLLAAASVMLLGAAPVFAQSAEDVEKAPPTAKVKAKAKKKAAPKGKNAGDITVINARADGITSVTLTTAKGKTIAVVKKSLPAGAKHSMKLPAGSGCEFTVGARFMDGTEFEPTALNLCADKVIRFTDGEGVPAETPAPAAEE